MLSDSSHSVLPFNSSFARRVAMPESKNKTLKKKFALVPSPRFFEGIDTLNTEIFTCEIL